MKYVIKKSENPLKGLRIKECSNLSGEMSDCQTSEKTDDMSKDDINRENELFVEEITSTDVSCVQEKEIWRTCCYNGEIFEDYQVSSLGRVKSLKRKKPKILKKGLASNGYYSVSLSKDKKSRTCFLHRLVICSFTKELPSNYRQLDINHKNEDKTDNRLSNLEFMTHKENINHGSRNERTAKALSKEVFQFDLQGNLIKTWSSLTEVNRKLGFSQGNISKCCNGKAKTAYNYKWSYQPNLD